MRFQYKRFGFVLNVLLALGVFGLLVYLLLRCPANSAADNEASGATREDAASAPPVVRREVDAGRVGVQPVSFTRTPVRTCLPESPGMDMAETHDGYVLAFSLPGVRNEDIRLSLTGCVMTVQAVMRDKLGKQVGGLERRVLLPRITAAPAAFTACYTNGVLRVCVAK